MAIPNAGQAIIDRRKLTAYLLSDRHPVGRHKARVLRALGYNAADADRLARDLRTIARTGSVEDARETPFGVRYIADGQVRSPSGRVVLLRTIWVTPKEATTPRFVTAYPLRPRHA